ncbi:M23 family metallopeptidase [bacterium]|nr:M23 family metallopeptidase [bacterium]
MRRFSLHKLIKKKLTIMFIPHHTNKPLKVSIPSIFIYFILTCWAGLTVGSFFITTRHIDYLSTKQKNKALQEKVAFFIQETVKSQELISQVEKIDYQLRNMVALNSKKIINRYPFYASYLRTYLDLGKGGPSKNEQQVVDKLFQRNQFRKSNKELQINSNQQIKSFLEISKCIFLQKSILEATPCIWPTYGYISSRFGYRISPFSNKSEFHTGLDIANRKGSPVWTTADGIITVAHRTKGYGYVIIIKHGYGLSTYYAHNSKLLVKVGDYVTRGQIISYTGNTGRSTGNHLHYEVRVRGKAVNPIYYLK